MSGKSIQVAVRVEPEVVQLADDFAEETQKATGLLPKRAEVVRQAIRRGLEVMLAELKSKVRRR